MGSLRVRHDWVTFLSLFTFMHWRRKWQPTPVSCLENPRDGGAWWAAIYGVTQSQTWLKWLSSSSSRGEKTIKNTNIWKLNNTFLNNQQITEEIKKEIKICKETNENENATTQNLWDSVKSVLRQRFIAIHAYLKKQKKNQINNLSLHPNQLGKKRKKKNNEEPQVSWRQEIIKIRSEINEKETKETI